LLAGVLSALAVGMPFLRAHPHPTSAAHHPLECALDFGVLLASYTVTSPHSIHPDASLDNLLAFAQELNLPLSSTFVAYL
jgi:hypothetical protein